MNNEMNIATAQYVNETVELKDGTTETTLFAITATIDGVEMSVPLCVGNRHYDEIMRQVDAGTLVIADAE